MKIILASPRGFCAGVRRAIETLSLVLDRFKPPIYVYHEIVHNNWVVEHFREKGTIFVQSLDDVPIGSILLFSAHGVSPEIRLKAQQRELRTIDATCPLVHRIHRLAQNYAAQGFHIIFLGHAGHDEVVGTLGEAPGRITLVSSLEEIDKLDFPPHQPLTFLMQTTLSQTESEKMAQRIRERFSSQLKEPSNDGICFATQNRQNAVRKWRNICNKGLVVGSPNSSNSRRLAELAQETGIVAFLIDGPDDIPYNELEQHDSVLITAGASVPEKIINSCVAQLVRHFDATVEQETSSPENVVFFPPKIEEF